MFLIYDFVIKNTVIKSLDRNTVGKVSVFQVANPGLFSDTAYGLSNSAKTDFQVQN